MKNIFIKTNLFFVTFLICVACTNSSIKEKQKGVIDVVAGLQNEQDLKVSGYFSSLRFVPLESPGEAMIGEHPQWQVTDRYVVVSTNQDQCLLFEKESGRFIRQIGHKGDDPEAYVSAYGVVDGENDRILFPGKWGEAVIYGLDGNWKSKFKFPGMEAMYRPSFFPLTGDTLVGDYGNLNGDQKRRLLIYTDKGDSILGIANQKRLEPFDVKGYVMFTRHYMEDLSKLLGAQAVALATSEDPAITGLSFSGLSPFWKYKDQVYLKEEYNDTIYRVSTQGLQPHMVFDLGEYHWPYQERYRTDKENYIYILQVMETADLLFFRFNIALHSVEKQRNYNAIYEKSTRRVQVSPLWNGLKDDIYDFIPLQPAAVSSSGQLMAVVPAEEITMWIEENGVDALPADLIHLKNVREDDNPVLVFME